MSEESAESAQSEIDESHGDAREEIADLDEGDDMEERLEENEDAAGEVDVPDGDDDSAKPPADEE